MVRHGPDGSRCTGPGRALPYNASFTRRRIDPWTRAPTRGRPQRIRSANRPPAFTLATDGLLVIFAPVLLLIAVTAALAGAAWSMGWYRDEMQRRRARSPASSPCVLAIFLLYRQVRQREAATGALQSVRARVADIVESAMDPIVTIDGDQRIVLFNAAAEKVFGWPA